jgi:hypothetical protein
MSPPRCYSLEGHYYTPPTLDQAFAQLLTSLAIVSDTAPTASLQKQQQQQQQKKTTPASM